MKRKTLGIENTFFSQQWQLLIGSKCHQSLNTKTGASQPLPSVVKTQEKKGEITDNNRYLYFQEQFIPDVHSKFRIILRHIFSDETVGSFFRFTKASKGQWKDILQFYLRFWLHCRALLKCSIKFPLLQNSILIQILLYSIHVNFAKPITCQKTIICPKFISQ